MILFQVISGLALLTLGGELLVSGSGRLGRSFGMPKLFIGLTIVAFGTSSPELFVSVNAALIGNGAIAIGNVLGSNIFNILFILGISALITPLYVTESIIRRDIPIMIGLSFALYGLAFFGRFYKIEGFILIIGLGIYIFHSYFSTKSSNNILAEKNPKAITPLWRLGQICVVLISLGLLAFGSQMFVEGASAFAKSLGISDVVIGLTLVAAGTSFPELVTSIIASVRGERDIAIGNVIGSNIFNILGVVGMASLASPTNLEISQSTLLIDFPVMIISAVLCVPIFISGRTISRREGLFLFVSYIVYVIFLINN